MRLKSSFWSALLAAQLGLTALAWVPQLGAPERGALALAAIWLWGARLGARACARHMEGGGAR